MTSRLILGLLALMFAALPAHAHEGRPIYVEVTEEAQGRYSMRWKIPPVVVPGQEPLLSLTGSECTLKAGQQRPALIGNHIYTCTGTPESLAVSLSYPAANPVLSTLVRFHTLDGNEQSILMGPDFATVPLPLAETSFEVIKRYTLTGMDHILEGYDHLLFVLCLMLLSGSLKRILITVTGFTLGHSITLGMSALAGWSLPPTFVEPLIAFSILILAAEVASGRDDTIAYRFPALIATGFGLLHGFGFGGALAEIGLPYGMHIQALAFFNIGVELGQVLFVIVGYAAFRIAQQAASTLKSSVEVTSLKPLVIYPAGFIAAFWTIERVTGIWV